MEKKHDYLALYNDAKQVVSFFYVMEKCVGILEGVKDAEERLSIVASETDKIKKQWDGKDKQYAIWKEDTLSNLQTEKAKLEADIKYGKAEADKWSQKLAQLEKDHETMKTQFQVQLKAERDQLSAEIADLTRKRDTVKMEYSKAVDTYNKFKSKLPSAD